MTNDKGIWIKNIYYMLTYAFRILRQLNFEELVLEDFENIHDMLAAILAKGIARQLKQGFCLEYVEKEENLSAMRGKLNLKGTIQNRIQQKQMLACTFDELSENHLFHQILKTTMLILLRQNTVKASRKAALKKSLLYFNGVDEIELSAIRWDTIRFQRNNQSYRMLLAICHMILHGLLLSTEQGSVKLASVLDEQSMCRLYERFLLEYYRYHHPCLHANADQIAWDLDDGIADFLPVMQTDITLKQNGKILIIDAKYYAHTMQTNYHVQTLRSGNLYQIFTYVKNRDKEHTGNVAGMLLYAKTEEQIQPDHTFSMDGNKISVKTLNLNLPFREIANQLDAIVEEYF